MPDTRIITGFQRGDPHTVNIVDLRDFVPHALFKGHSLFGRGTGTASPLKLTALSIWGDSYISSDV